MKRQSDTPSPFEEVLQNVEQSLGSRFAPTVGSNPAKNLEELQALLNIPKFGLEALFSERSLISLNRKDYEHLQTRIGGLIEENRNALKQQRQELHLDSL